MAKMSYRKYLRFRESIKKGNFFLNLVFRRWALALSVIVTIFLVGLFFKKPSVANRDLIALFLFYGLSIAIYAIFALFNNVFMKSELLIGGIISFIIMFLSYMTIIDATTPKEIKTFRFIFNYAGAFLLILEILCSIFQHPKEKLRT